MYSLKIHKSLSAPAMYVEPALGDLHGETVDHTLRRDKVTLAVSEEKCTSYKNKGVENKRQN